MSVGSYGGLPYTPRRVPSPPAAPAVLRPTVALRPVEFRTVAEVATHLRVSKMTVYRLIHGGEVDAVRVGRSFRIPQRAIDTYLRRNGLDGEQ